MQEQLEKNKRLEEKQEFEPQFDFGTKGTKQIKNIMETSFSQFRDEFVKQMKQQQDKYNKQLNDVKKIISSQGKRITTQNNQHHKNTSTLSKTLEQMKQQQQYLIKQQNNNDFNQEQEFSFGVNNPKSKNYIAPTTLSLLHDDKRFDQIDHANSGSMPRSDDNNEKMM